MKQISRATPMAVASGACGGEEQQDLCRVSRRRCHEARLTATRGPASIGRERIFRHLADVVVDMAVAWRRHRGGRRRRARSTSQDHGGRVIVAVEPVVEVVVVVADLDDLRCSGADDADPACTSTNGGEHEHPTAAHPEITSVAGEGHEDVDAEEEQRHANDAAHGVVEPVRYFGGQHDREQHRARIPPRHAPTRRSVASIIDPRPLSCDPVMIGQRGDMVPVNAVTKSQA